MIWLVVLIPLILFVLGYWAHRHPSKAASQEPMCGQCGYIVVGLPSSICPECGQDLREVGITYPPAVRERVTRAGLLLLWSVLLLACGVASYYWLIARLPNFQRHYTMLELELPEPAPEPHGPLVVQMKRRAKFDRAARRPVVGTATIEIASPRSGPATFVVRYPEMSWRFEGRKIEWRGTANDLDQATLLEWLRFTGVDTCRPGMEPAVEELLAQLDLWHSRLQASTYDVTTWSILKDTTRDGWSDHEMLKWGMWLFWVLIGFGGIQHYRRRERRQSQSLAEDRFERQGASHLGGSAT